MLLFQRGNSEPRASKRLAEFCPSIVCPSVIGINRAIGLESLHRSRTHPSEEMWLFSGRVEDRRAQAGFPLPIDVSVEEACDWDTPIKAQPT